MDILVISIIVAGATIAIGTIGPALGQGRSVANAMEGISRQPEAAGPIQTNLIVGLAFMESLTIYALLIALIVLFANPYAKGQSDVAAAKAKVQVLQAELDQAQVQAKIDDLKKAVPAK